LQLREKRWEGSSAVTSSAGFTASPLQSLLARRLAGELAASVPALCLQMLHQPASKRDERLQLQTDMRHLENIFRGKITI
jgi:hypothetical protein